MKFALIKQIVYCLLLIIAVIAVACNNTKNKISDDEILSLDSASIEQITEEIRKNPKNAKLFAKRAEAYSVEGNIEEAINDMNIAIKLDSINADYYIRLSELYIGSAKSKEAKTTLEKCLETCPQNIDATLKLAELYLFVEDYKNSAQYLMKAENIEQQNPKIYFLKAMINRQMGEIPKAIDNLRIAVEKNPEYYDAYILLGLSCAQSKDTLAEQYYKIAIDLKPESIEARYNIAMYYQENGKYEQAFEQYNYIVDSIDNNFLNSYYNTGYIYLEYLKNYDKAIEYFTKVIDSDFSFVEAYYNRGLCFEKKGDKKNALLDYQTCLKIATNYQLAIDGINRLDENK